MRSHTRRGMSRLGRKAKPEEHEDLAALERRLTRDASKFFAKNGLYSPPPCPDVKRDEILREGRFRASRMGVPEGEI